MEIEGVDGLDRELHDLLVHVAWERSPEYDGDGSDPDGEPEPGSCPGSDRGSNRDGGPAPVSDPVPHGAVSVAGRLARIDAEIAALQQQAFSDESDDAVALAAVEVQRIVNSFAAAQVRLIGEAAVRQVHRRDGAASLASWLRERTRVDAGHAQRLAETPARLEWLPEITAAFITGDIGFDHVTAVTRALVGRRRRPLIDVEDALLLAARHGLPRDVAALVRKVKEQVDADGSDTPPLPPAGPDARRQIDLQPTIDGLWHLRGSLDVLTGELLATLLHHWTQPDPVDLPADQRRSAGQRRHDALHALLEHLAEAGTSPTRHGAAPHVLLMVDVLSLVGLIRAATRPAPTLRFAGATTIAIARRLLAANSVKATAVLTMGPYRVVGVGATSRTLPSWLRPMLQMLHQRCRGPDCDRPVMWADAHHVEDWDTHHDTDLNRTVPLCRAHHTMLTTGTWTMTYDTDTAICTWTSPTGQPITTYPPPP